MNLLLLLALLSSRSTTEVVPLKAQHRQLKLINRSGSVELKPVMQSTIKLSLNNPRKVVI